jgi:hypothetical protein
MKRLYTVTAKDEEYCFAIVAESTNQAKMLGMRCYDGDFEYIDMRTKCHKEINVDHLPIGEVDDCLWALKAGAYAYLQEEECPRCKQEGRVYYDNGYYCDNCEGYEPCPKCTQYRFKDGKCEDCEEEAKR